MKTKVRQVIVAGLSGGPDSSYLLLKYLLKEKGVRIVAGHVNYGLRGIESERDQEVVEAMAGRYGFELDIFRVPPESGSRKIGKLRERFPAGFEKNARDSRYGFLKELAKKAGAERIVVAHTADDQVETILMRIFEGAGIKGLKGIPRKTEDGVERPMLDVWKEDIVRELTKNRIPFRIDRSNFDTRVERNWLRRILIPSLVKRYGKAVKKRIFTLGERFRELDDYLEGEAERWIRRNVNVSRGIVFRRDAFSSLPSVLRMKVLQRICFDRLGVAPNERLLDAMDRTVSHGGPSARVSAGKGWKLSNRYEDAIFEPGEKGADRKSAIPGSREKEPIPLGTPGEYKIPMGREGRFAAFEWKPGGKGRLPQPKRLSAKGDAEVFDADGLKLPLTIRPLRAGDRILPFGAGVGKNARDGEKKVKEILIDRKVPRDDRWGRPVLCDAGGAILWIPGVLRSAHAPVTPRTRKTAVLRIRSAE